MHIAQVNFRVTAAAQRERCCDAVFHLLNEWQRNGQIARRDWAVAWKQGSLSVTVAVPEARSLQGKPSQRVRLAMKAVLAAGLKQQRVQILGQAPDSSEVCGCRQRSCLLLQTSWSRTDVPLQCGDCDRSVPLYRIPHTSPHGTYEDVLFWEGQYKAYDTVWTASGSGERSAYAQLSRHDSELSRIGRDICKQITKSTGTPTYYYLYRWYARSAAADRRRPCPGCGGQWLLEEPWLGWLDFRCDRCRLASHIGYDVA